MRESPKSLFSGKLDNFQLSHLYVFSENFVSSSENRKKNSNSYYIIEKFCPTVKVSRLFCNTFASSVWMRNLMNILWPCLLFYVEYKKKIRVTDKNLKMNHGHYSWPMTKPLLLFNEGNCVDYCHSLCANNIRPPPNSLSTNSTITANHASVKCTGSFFNEPTLNLNSKCVKLLFGLSKYFS